VTRATVVGDALLDVVVSPSGPMRRGADIPAAIRIGAGGQGANLAVRLARRGISTDLACGLGTDPAGELLRRAIEPEGVRLRPIPVAATGIVGILLDADGERTMLSQRAPFGSALDPQTLPEADWTLVSGYLLLEADAASLARALAARPGRRALVGCTVPDDAAAGWLAAAEALRPDLVIVNRDEAAAVGPLRAALAVTDAAGASATVGAISVTVPSEPGPAAADTTGAGDAFAAGLVAALARAEWPPERNVLETALGSALQLAAAVARAPGAQARVAGEPS
jgi:sugar/nucleoside kinase (ribokinase family)